jgi:DNA (cytosine-5)-methyltransferase 1
MIKERFEKIGYDVKMQVLNAADYGVPQKRERVIFIGGYDGLPVNFPDQTYRKKQTAQKICSNQIFRTG